MNVRFGLDRMRLSTRGQSKHQTGQSRQVMASRRSRRKPLEQWIQTLIKMKKSIGRHWKGHKKQKGIGGKVASSLLLGFLSTSLSESPVHENILVCLLEHSHPHQLYSILCILGASLMAHPRGNFLPRPISSQTSIYFSSLSTWQHRVYLLMVIHFFSSFLTLQMFQIFSSQIIASL